MEEEHLYLTPAGVKRIQKHYQRLCRQREEEKKNRRSRLSFLSKISIEDKDLSPLERENSLEKKIRETKFLLDHYQLIAPPKGGARKRISLGAIVTVEISRKVQKFQIVDSPEVNPDCGRIGRSSPLAKALFGRVVGEEVRIETQPPQKVRIKKLKYQKGK
jgi:transcription elongation factor GreA